MLYTDYPKAVEYVEQTGRDWDLYNNKADFHYFEQAWKNYLKMRNLYQGIDVSRGAIFPTKYGPK